MNGTVQCSFDDATLLMSLRHASFVHQEIVSCLFPITSDTPSFCNNQGICPGNTQSQCVSSKIATLHLGKTATFVFTSTFLFKGN